jgi:hypothetical protein
MVQNLHFLTKKNNMPSFEKWLEYKNSF